MLSRDFAFYGLLDLLQRSLSIIMLPIYTRVLSQTSYGDLDIIFTVSSALLVLVDLQLVPGFSRFYLSHRDNGYGPRFAGSAILTRLALGTVITSVFLALGYSGLMELKFIPSFLANGTAWTLMALGVPLTLVYDILLLQTQMLRRKRWFFIGVVGNSIFSITLCILFTLVVPLGIMGVALGQLLGKLVSTLFLCRGLRGEVSLSYHAESMKEALSYTLPLVPGWWIGFSSAYICRFFVYGELGAAENALLAITMKLTSVLGLFCIAFRTAWIPLAMAYIDNEGGEAFYIRSLRLFMAGGMFSVFSLTVLAGPILIILAPQSYGAAVLYIPVFLVGGIISELDFNIQLGNQISKKTYWISIASAVTFTINLIVLVLFTHRFGIYAAGLGFLVAFIAKVCINYFSAQRNYKIHYDKRALLVFCFGCVVLLALSAGRNSGVVPEAMFIGMAALLSILLPSVIFTVPERQAIRALAVRAVRQLANFRSVSHP